MRHHATVGIGQLEVETGAIARGTERFGRDAAPAPVAVARQLGRGGHAGRAVRLGQGDGGLTAQGEAGAREPGLELGRGARASQRAQGRLRLDRDVHIPVRDERERETDERTVLERGERPQRIDADVAVAIAEQRPDAGDHLGRSDLRAVAHGAGHTTQRDSAHVRFAIGERAEQRRNRAR